MQTSLRALASLTLVLAGCHASTPGRDSASADPPSVAPPPSARADAPPAPGKVGGDAGHAGKGTTLTPSPGHALAAFAGGCFWGVEDAFRKVPGVTATTVGYSGGRTKDPTYEDVCGHGTGHAEVVLVEFDPKVVGYEKLVSVFFRIHDPTTLNRQGPDVGDQYRSAIFTFSPEQEAVAKREGARVEEKIKRRVVTVIAPVGPFYRAEDYHQQYAERTGHHGCPIQNVVDET